MRQVENMKASGQGWYRGAWYLGPNTIRYCAWIDAEQLRARMSGISGLVRFVVFPGKKHSLRRASIPIFKK